MNACMSEYTTLAKHYNIELCFVNDLLFILQQVTQYDTTPASYPRTPIGLWF